jgi:nucleoside-diphosphate-sugar epimerase
LNANSDYHAVVNPDIFIDTEALLEALRFMQENSDVGLLSPAVFGEDGERHYLCKRHPTLLVMFLRSFSPSWLKFFLRAVVEKFEMRDCDYDRPIHPLEYPTGCFMFFRTMPLQLIGGFAPDFFLHYEDADIGRRMLQVARVVYVPSVRVVHQWARDTHRSIDAMLVTVRSGWLYWRKWGGLFCNKSVAERTADICKSDNTQPDPSALLGQRVLVTGANGFIGQAVCVDLSSRGYRIYGATRGSANVVYPAAVEHLAMGDIDDCTDWANALSGVDSIVHLAARVHHMHETINDPLEEYRRVNVALTLNLARQAVNAGVRRFIFVSSVKVNGEQTPFGQPFTAEDVPSPQDPYGLSKYEAEQALIRLSQQTSLEIVILRPVLVYGPGVKANFEAMMRWLQRGVPLPLGALDNQRSLIALENLTDCIAICLQHPAAANQTFLVSDGEDLTVTALLRRTAAAFGKPARLVSVPMFVLRLTGHVFGKEAIVNRLCDTLQVDITKIQRMLGWVPPTSVDAALAKAAKYFLSK